VDGLTWNGTLYGQIDAGVTYQIMVCH